LPEKINRGQMVFRRECGNSRGLDIPQRIGENNYRVGVLGGGRGKGGIEFADRGRLYYRQSHAPAWRHALLRLAP